MAIEASHLFHLNYTPPEGCKLTINKGGTSSGKTYGILLALCMIMIREKGRMTTVVGQDIPNLKRGAIRDMWRILSASPEIYRHVKGYNISERILTFQNGSQIEFNSYADEQDAKNGKRDYLFANEVNGLKEAIFIALYDRTSLHTWVDFNPSADFWLNIKGYHKRPDARLIHSTFRNNPFLSDSIREKIMAYEPTAANIAAGTADPYRWKVYGEGEYAPQEGAIIRRWQRGKFDKTIPYVFGLDWGVVDPFVIVRFACDHDKRKIYVKQECYKTGMNPGAIVRTTKNLCGEDTLIICDSAQPQSINELRQEGLNAVRAFKKPYIVLQRLRWLQDYLIIVDDSPDIEKELNNYTWADGRGEVPIDKYNHAIDAIGYAMTYWRMNVLRV